jgi:hypothetical protein
MDRQVNLPGAKDRHRAAGVDLKAGRSTHRQGRFSMAMIAKVGITLGEKNFVGKAMGLVVSMDTMIGGQFEKGLARMKSIVELGPTRHAAAGGGQ